MKLKISLWMMSCVDATILIDVIFVTAIWEGKKYSGVALAPTQKPEIAGNANEKI